MTQTWKLDMGCHAHTITSRDMAIFDRFPTDFNDGAMLLSFEDCVLRARIQADIWARAGYFVWYATAIAPDGTRYQEIIPTVQR